MSRHRRNNKRKERKKATLRDLRNNLQRVEDKLNKHNGCMPSGVPGCHSVKPAVPPKPPAVPPKPPVVTKVMPEPQPVDTAWPRGVRNQLRWSPYAWAKLKWFCARGDTEVGGFGVTAIDDMLYVEDFQVVKQTASVAKFDFDDEALNDYMTAMAEKGIPPNRCMRVWVHTHPGGLDSPSSTDEEVFNRVGNGTHNIMFILTEDGKTYAELRLRIDNMDASRKLSVAVEFRGTFAGVTPEQMAQWEHEYCTALITEHIQAAGTCQPYSMVGMYHQRWDEVVEDNAWQNAWANESRQSVAGNSAYADDDDVTPWFSGDDAHDITFDEDTVRLVIKDDKMDVPQWVYTNKYWFRFGGAATVYSKLGDKVKSMSDLASYLPRAWGEVEWKPDTQNDGMEIGELLTVFIPQLGFVACGEDGEPFADALAAAELAADSNDIDIPIDDEKVQVQP